MLLDTALNRLIFKNGWDVFDSIGLALRGLDRGRGPWTESVSVG